MWFQIEHINNWCHSPIMHFPSEELAYFVFSTSAISNVSPFPFMSYSPNAERVAWNKCESQLCKEQKGDFKRCWEKRYGNSLVNPCTAEGASIAVWLLQLWESWLVENHWILGHPFFDSPKIFLHPGTRSHFLSIRLHFRVMNVYLSLPFWKRVSQRHTYIHTHTHTPVLFMCSHKGNIFQNKPNLAFI